LALITFVLVGAGCTTTLDGRIARAGNEGLRYYLPAPHIYLVPQADGSVLAEVKYLPDPSRAYTLNLNAYLSAATFDVQTSNGLLTSVSLDSDSSAVAVAAVQAAKDIRVAKLTAEQAQVQARKTQDGAKQAAVKSATAEVLAQREALDLLLDKRKFYVDNPIAANEETRRDLELEISQAKLKLAQLEHRVGLARDAASSSFNDPGAGSDAGAGKAYGPIFFRVLPEGRGVKLVAVEPQLEITTTAGALAVQVGAAQMLTPTAKRFDIKSADTQRQFVVKFNAAVTVEANASKLLRPSDSSTAPVIAGNALKIFGSSDGKEVRIDLPPTLAPGRYRLDLTVQPAGGQRQLFSFVVSWLES
jgi:hypothetical protein